MLIVTQSYKFLKQEKIDNGCYQKFLFQTCRKSHSFFFYRKHAKNTLMEKCGGGDGGWGVNLILKIPKKYFSYNDMLKHLLSLKVERLKTALLTNFLMEFYVKFDRHSKNKEII